VAELGNAVREVIDDPRYAAAARVIADEMSGLPPVDEAVDALAELVWAHSSNVSSGPGMA
jgi:hypothetical protein